MSIAAIVVALVAAACSSPSPSLAPSGAPEASPGTSPGVGLDFQLAALTERIRAGLQQQGQFVTSLATASIESPVPSGAVPMSLIALAMTNWAGSERQWLADHPPEACYAAVQARYAQAVDAIAAAGAAFARLGAGSPGASDDPAAAVTALTGARSTIEDANAQATAVAAACSTGA